MRNKHTFPLSTAHVWATNIAWRVLAWLHFGTFIADRGEDGKIFPLEWVNAIEAQRFPVSRDPILLHHGVQIGWMAGGGLASPRAIPSSRLAPLAKLQELVRLMSIAHSSVGVHAWVLLCRRCRAFARPCAESRTSARGRRPVGASRR